MIRKDVFCQIEPEFGHLGQNGTFFRYHVIQNDIETANSVGCYHDQAVAVIINFAYLTLFDWL